MRAIYEGAAHRNIKLGYGALHLKATVLTFLLQILRCAAPLSLVKIYLKSPKY
jgi:hypothetical protein